MTTLSRPLLSVVLLLASIPYITQAEPVEIAGMTFTAPDSFKSEKPSSAMRKAQYAVGDGEKAAQIVFFYFGAGGAGGVDANVNRWFGQFVEEQDKINAKTEKTKAGDADVTFVSAQGTFKSGPPRGPVVEKPGYALLGAIVEGKEGAIFAKFTGPEETVKAHAEAFKKMITSAK